MRLATEIYTPHVRACRDFYVDFFGFAVELEAEGFVVLRPREAPTGPQLLFCLPNSPFVQPLFHPAFAGQGVLLQWAVADLDAEYGRLRQLAAPIVLAMIEEPFNGRHFTLRDPAGLLVDVVQAAVDVA